MLSTDQRKEIVKKATELGQKLYTGGNLQSAELLLDQAVRAGDEAEKYGLDIGVGPACKLLGTIRHHQKRYDDGAKLLGRAVRELGDDHEIYNNLGLCYAGDGKSELAIKNLELARALAPDKPYTHANLGLQYRAAGRTQDAISCFKKSLTINHNDPHNWCMLGGCYGELRELEDAELCFKTAIKIDPQFPAAHVDLAFVYHLKGEWDKAWPEYEWRFQCYEQNKIWAKIYDPAKKWGGKASLAGKSILVHAEQGQGDTIHFYRYISLLKKTGAWVILHCWEGLVPLLTADEVFTDEPDAIKPYKERDSSSLIPEHDYHASIVSLPYLLGSPPIPSEPYIFPPEGIKLEGYSDYKVGIVWAGNPQHPNDANRSFRLSCFRPIHDLPGVKLFNLQKETKMRMYRHSSEPIDLAAGCNDMKIVDLSAHMGNFAETASIISSLDLVITADTSVLHLAGAMGKKTWAAVPYNGDWRWGLAGDKTVWYPTVRLFRQPQPGDWESVFSSITCELKKEIHER